MQFGDFVTRNKAKEAWLVLLQVQRTFPRDPVIQYYAALGSSFLTHSQYNSKVGDGGSHVMPSLLTLLRTICPLAGQPSTAGIRAAAEQRLASHF